MTDWPEAVREWDAEQWESVGNGNYVLKRADAAIAALQEMVLETKHGLKMANEDTATAMRQAENAEAEVRRLQDSLKQSHFAYGDKYAEVEQEKENRRQVQIALNEAEAEVARLKWTRRKLARWLPMSRTMVENTMSRPDLPLDQLTEAMAPEDWIAVAEYLWEAHDGTA